MDHFYVMLDWRWDGFKELFRITKEVFNYILREVEGEINTSSEIPPIWKLAASLRFFVEGGCQRGICNEFYVGVARTTFCKILKEVLNLEQGPELFNKMHVTRRPETDIFLMEAELINKCKRTLADGGVKNPIEKLRLLCLSRGSTGIHALGHCFRRMDGWDEGKTLNLDEFIQGFKDTGLDCGDEEIAEIFDAFDTDGTGTINVSEFLVALRPPMSEGRKSIIETAFEKLDKTGDNVITVDDIKRVFSVKNHPSYGSGDLTEEQILKLFLGHFEEGRYRDGRVTKEEFIDYYSGVSATIDNDTYFDLMMRQSYKL